MSIATRYKYEDSLAEMVATNLGAFKPLKLDRSDSKHAAVAFTLVDCSAPAGIGDIPFHHKDSLLAGFILTTRAVTLSSHAGQRAFPGGRVDPGENVEQAALRELQEEVGLQLDPDCILGRLDDYATRSGFVISPVVVWGGKSPKLTPNPAEVACIHRIPLHELMRDEVPLLDTIAESSRPVLRMPLGDDWFAAPSAAIAYQFREVALLGRDTRVSHFEQPHFAWQ